MTRRRRTLMRLALTRATARYTAGGRLKAHAAPRPVTLAAQSRRNQELETGAAAGNPSLGDGGLRRPPPDQVRYPRSRPETPNGTVSTGRASPA